ncbi:M61 family metallopeptidase [Chloracidobacterium validum]|uniref:M61 family metallopeptidase n=1 Tax=Chloracidobacterium validum TaxID=2821543 RepID=A0ABX8BBK2_9BACT|nr:PDZ domain-containing protein [Chloracidobacterium validum]QUW03130.1 M61 family metallopeptidase [Chloracidobacterium validum]
MSTWLFLRRAGRRSAHLLLGCCWFGIFAFSLAARAQTSKPMIEYNLTPQAPNSHLITVTIRYKPMETTKVVDFALPAWRPGRYQIQNYARNVRDFTATDQSGRTLAWEKVDKSTWRVPCGGVREVRVAYAYYANTLDAGSTLWNDEELYWNGTNLLMYVVGQKDRPARLSLTIPQSWQCAYPLKKVGEPFVYEAPDYDTLADAPGIASPTLNLVRFDHAGTTYHLAFQGPVSLPLNELAGQVERIVAATVAMFGGKAPFADYWFLYHSLPGGRFHGVEHLNSTSITFPSSVFDERPQRFYAITAHEFFHAWNVKRIRPQGLGPFDYSREVHTRNLWVAEGVTSYYDDLLCRRAGVISVEDYLRAVATTIASQQRTPGRLVTPVTAASFDAWLTPDDSNVRVDFYTKGALVALLLDLDIRRRTGGAKSLDDAMRWLSATYAERGVGYPENGMQLAVEAVTGASYADFFARYVDGTDELPYGDYLEVVGVELIESRPAKQPKVSLGIELAGDERQTVIANVLPTEAGFQAGLDRGDILVALDGEQATMATLPALLMKRQPGEVVKVLVFRRGKLREFSVTLQPETRTDIQLRPVAAPSPTQARLYREWLGLIQPEP